MAPLYAKLNTQTYHPLLTEKDRRILQWWVVALKNLTPRRVTKRTDRPDIIMFTDAATSTRIIAAVTIVRDDFITNESVKEVLTLTTGKHWGRLFDSTNLIYGLEMLALLTKLYQSNEDLIDKNITFHIDNRNAFDALVKNSAKPTVITAMTHLIWHRLNTLRITPWFEWVPGTKNIADLPTRKVTIPFKITTQGEFKFGREIHLLVKNATEAMETGRPIVAPKTL